MISTRRLFLRELAVASVASLSAGVSRAAPTPSAVGALPAASLGPLSLEALASLEAQSGGRLGVAILDADGAERAQHRGDERFPMCSTFKLLLVGALLARVDRGQERLERSLEFKPADLLEYAPVVRARAGEGRLSVEQACEAAITLSDNSAANLLLATLGGPARLTEFARTLGDTRTRLDRDEPSLNECLAGDERDTTTPRAMARTLCALVVGPALSKASRERLAQWLVACSTGRARLRAGVPPTWRAGDKTGTGHAGTTNDVAILWPPGGRPLVIAAYLTQTSASADVRNGVLAELARRVTTAA